MPDYTNEMYNLAKNGLSWSTDPNANDAVRKYDSLQRLQKFQNEQRLYDPNFWSQIFNSSAPATTPTSSGVYDARLNSLMSDPNSIANSAGYKFRLDQGNQAIQRSAAAKGMLGSGNTLAELLRYGQGEAAQEYGNEVSRLTTLRGQDLGLQAQREKAALDAKNNFMTMMSQQLFKSLNQPTY